MAKKVKIIQTSGKKKTAVSRVRVRDGKGVVKVNGIPLEIFEPESARRVMQEPFHLAEKILGEGFVAGLDVRANVKGGGIMGQAHATRTAFGKALVEWSESEDLKKLYHAYDRSLIIDDVRRSEPKKFLRKGARARPTKSYR